MHTRLTEFLAETGIAARVGQALHTALPLPPAPLRTEKELAQTVAQQFDQVHIVLYPQMVGRGVRSAKTPHFASVTAAVCSVYLEALAEEDRRMLLQKDAPLQVARHDSGEGVLCYVPVDEQDIKEHLQDASPALTAIFVEARRAQVHYLDFITTSIGDEIPTSRCELLRLLDRVLTDSALAVDVGRAITAALDLQGSMPVIDVARLSAKAFRKEAQILTVADSFRSGKIAMAELSTAHITETDGQLLGQPGVAYRVAEHKDHYGTLFFVPCDHSKDEVEQQLMQSGFSSEFVNLFYLAQEEGIRFLYFDGASDVVDGLPIFEW